MNKQSMISYDLETTGLSFRDDRVIEIGAVAFDLHGEVDTFESLVNPEGRPCHPRAIEAHGLLDDMLSCQRPASEVMPEFLDWIDRIRPSLMVSYNLRFDRPFIEEECRRSRLILPRVRSECSLELARRKLPGLPNYKLATVASHLNLDLGDEHRALADARRAGRIWVALKGGV